MGISFLCKWHQVAAQARTPQPHYMRGTGSVIRPMRPNSATEKFKFVMLKLYIRSEGDARILQTTLEQP
ncbi:MAG: hypothetical protein CMM62_14540 [Rhodospirillaceae bacterium]|nr:hypothetical protein [Rhodospirillaceae bacterium]